MPATTDQIVINAAHTVLLDVDAKGCTSGVGQACLTVNGSFIFDDASTGRDADGWRNFTMVADADADSEIDFGASSTFVMGKSDRLLCNSTSGACTMARVSGSKVVIRGSTWDTTVAAITDAAASAATCGNTRGRMYTITPAAFGDKAKLYRRVLFKSGKARNWQFNIAAVAANGSTFTICTDETDAAQPCTAAGVPYGFCTGLNLPLDASCTAAATPYAACTGSGTSKNNQRLKQHAPFNAGRVFPTSKASIPAEYGNSVCTAAGNPYPCCSGSGAGTCLGVIPALGDQVTIIDDAVVMQSAGANGWSLFDPSAGATPMMDIYAVNMASGTSSSGEAISLVASANGLACNFLYNNLHDYVAAHPATLRGCQGPTVQWNVCHDAGAGAGESAGCIEVSRNATSGIEVSNITLTDNHGFRTKGQAFALAPSGVTQHSTGTNRVQRNLIHDGCTTAAGECDGMEVGRLDGVDISDNLIYDLCSGTPGAESPFAINAGASDKLLGSPAIHRNIVLNSCGGGINNVAAPGAANPVGYGGQVFGITGNYISNTKSSGILGGGGAYGNVVKNWSLRLPISTVVGAIRDVVTIKGNVALFSDTVAASADCTGGNFCVRLAYISSTLDGPMNNKPLVTMTDNYFGGQFIVTGGAAGMAFGVDPFQGSDQSMTIHHNTCDGHGTVGNCIDLAGSGGTIARTMMVADIAATHLGNTGKIFAKATDTDFTCNVDRLNRVAVGTTTMTAAASDGVCAGAGSTETNNTTLSTLGLKDRLTPDFAPGDRSLLVGAGGSPTGTDIGVRAFTFNFNKWLAIWPVMSFDAPLPRSFTNTGSRDTDGDGVVDLFDNCMYVFNPGQQDANADGRGDAC